MSRANTIHRRYMDALAAEVIRLCVADDWRKNGGRDMDGCWEQGADSIDLAYRVGKLAAALPDRSKVDEWLRLSMICTRHCEAYRRGLVGNGYPSELLKA